MVLLVILSALSKTKIRLFYNKNEKDKSIYSKINN